MCYGHYVSLASSGCNSIGFLRKERRLRALENRVLRRIFGPKRNDVTGAWRRLYKKELYALYFSASIIRRNKAIRMSSARHVPRMGKGNVHTGFWWVNLREGDPLEDQGVNGRAKLQWIFQRWDGRAWNGLIWLRNVTGGGLM